MIDEVSLIHPALCTWSETAPYWFRNKTKADDESDVDPIRHQREGARMRTTQKKAMTSLFRYVCECGAVRARVVGGGWRSFSIDHNATPSFLHQEERGLGH